MNYWRKEGCKEEKEGKKEESKKGVSSREAEKENGKEK